MERFSAAPHHEALLPAPFAVALFYPRLDAQDDVSTNVEFDTNCTYPTPFGVLTFEELIERTRKYAAYSLHHTYQVHEANIDDGLQAGYLRLWQRLQQCPELLQDKSLAWIGKGIIFSALHATRGDWQFRRHTLIEGEEEIEGRMWATKKGFVAHSRESRQTDTRIDLHRAIERVAQNIVAEKRGKRRDHDLWALYGLTMLQVSASELSRLFSVREQSMQAAYNRVRQMLQDALPNYKPQEVMKPFTRRGREALPQQDLIAIRKANGDVSNEIYEAVKALIETINADTRRQDELALEGIRQDIPIQTQAWTYGLPQHQMQRAYARVHLMIGAQRDPNVRMRRPERRVKSVFTLTEATTIAVEQLALDLLKQPKSYEKLVALHAHINNLAISTTAKHFNIPTSTLRYYAQAIGKQLMTPTKPLQETLFPATNGE